MDIYVLCPLVKNTNTWQTLMQNEASKDLLGQKIMRGE